MNTTLVIMAAGIGSRFGGLKQATAITDDGKGILDFSVLDAKKAGFDKAVIILREDILSEFDERIGKRLKNIIDTTYVIQDTSSLPEGRKKPFGTGHAILACKDVVKTPFCIINADDYYGPGSFASVYEYLSENRDDDKYSFCMAGYQLKNTVTENGHVSRGVCETDDKGFLRKVTERTKIMKDSGTIAYTEDDGSTWVTLDPDTVVSMNFWGFSAAMMDEMKQEFPHELEKILETNPLKGEYYLPFAADRLVQEGKARVKVITSPDKWYGVTYKEDKEDVQNALQAMKDKGMYPEKLWK